MAVPLFTYGQNLPGADGGAGLVVPGSGHGALESGIGTQDFLDKNVLFRHRVSASGLADFYGAVYWPGKMVDGPQCFSAVYRSSDYPDYGLDQQHVSPDVERHLAGYQY